MRYKIKDCFNTEDFRKLAKKKLPFPVFHYIDGAADDEVTLKRNTQAFEDVDLVPNVLKGVEDIDISTELMGKKLSTHYSSLLQPFKDYSIMKVKLLSVRLLKNLILFLGYHL